MFCCQRVGQLSDADLVVGLLDDRQKFARICSRLALFRYEQSQSGNEYFLAIIVFVRSKDRQQLALNGRSSLVVMMRLQRDLADRQANLRR